MVEAARGAGRVLDVAFNHRQRGDIQTLKRVDRGGPARRGRTTRRRGGCGGPGSRRSGAGSRAPTRRAAGRCWTSASTCSTTRCSCSASRGSRRSPRRPTTCSAAPASAPSPEMEKSGATGAKTFDVEDLATVFMRLEDGGTLLVEASWAAHRTAGDEFGITIYGTEGGAELIVRDMEPIGSLRIFTDEAGVAAETDAEPARRHRPRRGRRAVRREGPQRRRRRRLQRGRARPDRRRLLPLSRGPAGSPSRRVAARRARASAPRARGRAPARGGRGRRGRPGSRRSGARRGRRPRARRR